MCERTTRNAQVYRHLHVLQFILYLTFTTSLYDGKICLFSYGSDEINKQTHSLTNGRFQLRGHFWAYTSIDVAFRLCHRLYDTVR